MKNKFKNFLDNESKKDYFIELFKKIANERKTNNVFPDDNLIFESLNYCEPEDIKLIILGQDPYYTKGYADGLAFSSAIDKCPKSLSNIIKELKKDYPMSIINTYSLKSWAKNGVLLLNTILTVNENKPKSHANFGWEIFVKNLLSFILKVNKKAIFGIWGNEALKVVKNIVDSERIIYLSHPSPFSYDKGRNSFKDSSFFKKVNEKLENDPINFDIRKE
ncbi:uracil-DNA glycosylase [Mycoplasma sp. U97]|uniref:uracil-DNA glycosylase n=1 Tax=Mycoplasma tauri TaxID=547987 RepID=UPI001967E10D|nr:uracil-DNA glycosylase [Mycoplasma tauri]MBZ4212851.1 uracil-DNA glycosylase [Mycoplasma tauri]MBZ4226590.1 uracil-DNA glycosylase [Mycoplasma tauri]QSB07589.1 uracil-DNA glycosylase [Mycoplasma tauri]